jgi:ABC-type transport system substrate-binding protein
MDEYDQLYEQMLREPDVQKQVALSRRMSEIAMAYMPFIPHVVEVDNTFVQPWVSGFHPNDFTSYWKYLDVDPVEQRRAQLRSSRARNK